MNIAIDGTHLDSPAFFVPRGRYDSPPTKPAILERAFWGKASQCSTCWKRKLGIRLLVPRVSLGVGQIWVRRHDTGDTSQS